MCGVAYFGSCSQASAASKTTAWQKMCELMHHLDMYRGRLYLLHKLYKILDKSSPVIWARFQEKTIHWKNCDSFSPYTNLPNAFWRAAVLPTTLAWGKLHKRTDCQDRLGIEVKPKVTKYAKILRKWDLLETGLSFTNIYCTC